MFEWFDLQREVGDWIYSLLSSKSIWNFGVWIPMNASMWNKLAWDCITHKSILMMNSTPININNRLCYVEHLTMKIFRAFREFKCSIALNHIWNEWRWDHKVALRPFSVLSKVKADNLRASWMACLHLFN